MYVLGLQILLLDVLDGITYNEKSAKCAVSFVKREVLNGKISFK